MTHAVIREVLDASYSKTADELRLHATHGNKPARIDIIVGTRGRNALVYHLERYTLQSFVARAAQAAL